MSSIYLSTISSSPLNSAAQINNSPAVFPFSVGDIHTGIVEKVGPAKILLIIKNQSFLADSDLPLKVGDKLLVRVEQLQPQIVLKVVNPEDAPSSFIKDYAANLGFLLERSLLKTLQARREQGSYQAQEGLKGAFIKLTEELQSLIKDGKSIGREDMQKLTQLLKFAESAVKAIETGQIMNIVSQENDGRYVLQIPLLFPEGIMAGEIFIETGEKGKGVEKEKNKYRVAIFLSMDALGDMMVDVNMTGVKKIGCLFKFEDREALNFFNFLLPELENALSLLGYEGEYLTCIADKSLSRAREECRNELWQNQDVINLFA